MRYFKLTNIQPDVTYSGCDAREVYAVDTEMVDENGVPILRLIDPEDNDAQTLTEIMGQPRKGDRK